MNFGPDELVIMAKHVSNEPVLHEVFVIGGDAKGSHFKQQFVEVPEGTKVISDVEIKIKGKMKNYLFGKNKYEEYYDKIINDFAKMCRKLV